MPAKKNENQKQKHAAENKTADKKQKNAAPHTRKTDERTEAACDHNCRLSDYDIISDVLGGHKNLVKLYGTAMLEIDNEQLRKIINTQMSECACDQYDAFKYMNDRGMYKTEPAPVQKIKAARTKFGKNVVKSEAGASKIK
ncbi:MAG: spore coat protein [Firmicutes bacterium]|nr:spore coat protein [Bacillota bacterium]MDY5530867.1 spore coat protein [Pumilibacteraceae bacterium]